MENLPITTNIHPLRLPLPLPELKVSARLVATCIDQHAVSLIWLGQFFHALQSLEGAAALRRFVDVELRGSRGFSPANLDRYLTLGRHGLTLQDGEGSHFGLRLLKEAALFNDVRRQDLLAYGRGEERLGCLAMERLCQASRQASDPKEGRQILLHGLHGGGEPLRRVVTAAQRVDRVARSMKLLRQSVAEALANGARADAGQLALLELVVDAAVSEMREWLGSAAPAGEPEAPPQALPQPAAEVPPVASPLTGSPSIMGSSERIRIVRSRPQEGSEEAAAVVAAGAPPELRRSSRSSDAAGDGAVVAAGAPPELRRSSRSSTAAGDAAGDAAVVAAGAPPELRRSSRSSTAGCADEATHLTSEAQAPVTPLISELQTQAIPLTSEVQTPVTPLTSEVQTPVTPLTSEAQTPVTPLASQVEAPVAAEAPRVRVPRPRLLGHQAALPVGAPRGVGRVTALDLKLCGVVVAADAAQATTEEFMNLRRCAGSAPIDDRLLLSFSQRSRDLSGACDALLASLAGQIQAGQPDLAVLAAACYADPAAALGASPRAPLAQVRHLLPVPRAEEAETPLAWVLYATSEPGARDPGHDEVESQLGRLLGLFTALYQLLREAQVLSAGDERAWPLLCAQVELSLRELLAGAAQLWSALPPSSPRPRAVEEASPRAGA